MPLLAIPFPAIDPVLIQVGPFALHWYALAYIAGILLSWRFMRLLVQKDHLWDASKRPTPVDMDDFVTWGTLGIILGGRLGYVLFYNPAYYLQNPMEALALWSGGMSFHGGFIGTVFAMVLFAWSRNISVWRMFDLAGIAAPIGLFFGRIANFVNSELWGRPTDVPWAVVFPTGGPEARHPSQLYEAGLEGILLFIVLTLLVFRFKAFKKPGFIAGAFACGYGLSRCFVEFYRVPDPQLGYLAGFLTMGMLLSLPMILAGVAAMIWANRKSKLAA